MSAKPYKLQLKAKNNTEHFVKKMFSTWKTNSIFRTPEAAISCLNSFYEKKFDQNFHLRIICL